MADKGRGMHNQEAHIFSVRFAGISKTTHVVLVEDAKHQRCKLARVALREKLLVDFDETLLGEQPVRTVFQESLVPAQDQEKKERTRG